jgi:hypothetical protein
MRLAFKLHWKGLRYYPSVEMEGLNETMIKMSQDGRHTG